MMKLSDMPNIGPTLEKMLNEVGIKDQEDLCAIGSVEATKRLELSGQACFNKLYAIEGAIQGVRWHSLDKAFREELKKEFLK